MSRLLSLINNFGVFISVIECIIGRPRCSAAFEDAVAGGRSCCLHGSEKLSHGDCRNELA